MSSFRGDAKHRARNPYSRSWLWIPGSRQEARPGMTKDEFHAFSDATPSISISIFGSGSASTTQVVRAG
jgi:hypothetical protein